MEPTEHTGLLASYKFADWIGLQVGAVDQVTTSAIGVNARSESRRGFISLLTLTAPDSWGFLKGSALYGGLDYGPGVYGNPVAGIPGSKGNMTEWYFGTTINTPLKGLSLGASYDGISDADVAGIDAGSFEAFAGYVSYKFNDKASLNGRAEYANGSGLEALDTIANGVPFGTLDKVLAFTGTFEYDLWANVISRLEVRWDHNAGGGGPAFGGEIPGVATKNNELLIAANVIYKF
jgi:hypothetical protein